MFLLELIRLLITAEEKKSGNKCVFMTYDLKNRSFER